MRLRASTVHSSEVAPIRCGLNTAMLVGQAVKGHRHLLEKAKIMVRTSEIGYDPSMVPVRDLRGIWRVLAAIVVFLGPLSILALRAIMPYWTTDAPSTVVAKSLAHQSTMDIMVWAGLLFTPALLLSVVAIAYVARRGSPVLATVGGALSFIGWSMGATTVNMDYLVSQLGASGFDQAMIVRIGDSLQNSTFAAVGGIIWLVGHILGMVLIGIALGRAGIVKWWVAIALMVSQPFHFIAAVVIPSRLLDVTLGWGLTTIASAYVALAILRMTNDEWDLRPTGSRLATS